tara:strand:- start:15377 stop:15550 length:174 start_codon:yes stop_codon:yes gene_type:complete
MEKGWKFEYKRPQMQNWEPSLLDYSLKEALILGKGLAKRYPMFEFRVRKGKKTIYHN